MKYERYPDELTHYGVKGMKWGVRRRARKDAKEYARAKMFYGEGAGTRRKLIKAKVNERSKDPDYKKAFDDYLSKQDMSKHADKAKTERKVKDVKNSAAKTGRGIINIATGHPERVGAGLALAAAAYGVAKSTGADKVIAKAAKQAVESVYNTVKYNSGKIFVNDLYRQMGWTKR